VLFVAVVVGVISVVMIASPTAFARFAHSLRISIPAPDEDGRMTLVTRLSGVVFLCIALGIAAISAWR